MNQLVHTLAPFTNLLTKPNLISRTYEATCSIFHLKRWGPIGKCPLIFYPCIETIRFNFSSFIIYVMPIIFSWDFYQKTIFLNLYYTDSVTTALKHSYGCSYKFFLTIMSFHPREQYCHGIVFYTHFHHHFLFPNSRLFPLIPGWYHALKIFHLKEGFSYFWYADRKE